MKRANLKRLAALSAVGAGALSVTADRAEAGIISGTVASPNNLVGWNDPLTALPNLDFLLTGTGVTVSAVRAASTNTAGSKYYRFISMLGAGDFQWRIQGTASNVLRFFDADQTWSSFGITGGTKAYAGGRTWSTGGTLSDIYGPASFNSKYALFRFNPGDGSRYGWVELSYDVTAGTDASDDLGPILTVHRWAYESNVGTRAYSGQVPAVPEPGTLALAALAFGALGMRRWRASRQ